MGLRKGQIELVEQYRGGFCAIPAIPGGGKTHGLSSWAVEMISSGTIKPHKILIVTYMNSAVNNFKQRINSLLQQRGINGRNEFFVSTIHSLCMRIIKEKPDLLIVHEEFQIISDVARSQILSASLEEWKRENFDIFLSFLHTDNASVSKMQDIQKKWHEKLLKVLSSCISSLKTSGMTHKEASDYCQILENNSFLKLSCDILQRYEHKLKLSGYLDFDDILYGAKKILSEDSQILKKYQDLFCFVCEDEAQDSNPIQNDILHMIANGNFLRVGDSNQSICGSFTSSDFTLFKSFCEQPNVLKYQITQSSRNTLEIISLANYFVEYVNHHHPNLSIRNSLLEQYIEPVDANDTYPNPKTFKYGIRADVFETRGVEEEEITKRVRYMIEKYPDKTMAVLVPNSWAIESIVKHFEKQNISYTVLDNSSQERNKPLKMLGRVLDFISLPGHKEKWICFLDEVILQDDKSIKLSNEKKQILEFLETKSVEEILYPIHGSSNSFEIPEDILQNPVWNIYQSNKEFIRILLELPTSSLEKLIVWIGDKLKLDRLDRAIFQKVAEDVQFMMSENSNFQISDLALELLNPKSKFNYFASLVWELKGYEPTPGIPAICTYHKAKGLEWQAVFLTSITNSEFPVSFDDRFHGEFYFLKEQYKNPFVLFSSEWKKMQGIEIDTFDPFTKSKIETISERTRLLYVGITRAKEYLFLSGSYINKGKKHEIKPSEYLFVLKNKIDGDKEKWRKIH